MKDKQTKESLIRKAACIVFCALTGCGSHMEKEAASLNDSVKPVVEPLLRDTVVLRPAFNEYDISPNEYMLERLKHVRENFKRINSTDKWTQIDTIELWETTEGGEAAFYKRNNVLEKIVVRHFGETYQKLSEYYLLNGQLSFVLEKSYNYNRPLYHDSAAMMENNDSEAFDSERSEIIEDRSYFENGRLIHQINSQDCGSPFEESYLLEEEKRIKEYFDKLIKQKR